MIAQGRPTMADPAISAWYFTGTEPPGGMGRWLYRRLRESGDDEVRRAFVLRRCRMRPLKRAIKALARAQKDHVFDMALSVLNADTIRVVRIEDRQGEANDGLR